MIYAVNNSLPTHRRFAPSRTAIAKETNAKRATKRASAKGNSVKRYTKRANSPKGNNR